MAEAKNIDQVKTCLHKCYIKNEVFKSSFHKKASTRFLQVVF